MRPLICLITTPSGGGREEIDRIRAAARAGVHLVQIRKPGWDARDLTRLAEDAIAAVRGTRARVVINDRVDVALAAGAAGVHLRGDSAAPARVRSMTPPGFVIGRSVHGVDEAIQIAGAGGVDYLIFGTVFPTLSKPGGQPAGLAALHAVSGAVPVPVLAVGGVVPSRVGEVAGSGAAGFAAIGLFAECPLDGVEALVRDAERLFSEDMRMPPRIAASSE